MPNLVPLFTYAGGKREVVNNFSMYLVRTKTYIEPFFGGGAVWCLMNNCGLADHYVINDNNAELMRLYSDIKKYPRDVVDEAKELEAKYKKLAHDDLKHFYYRELDRYRNCQTSGRLLFLANTCFNGFWSKDANGLFYSASGHMLSILRPDRVIIDEEQVWLWSEALQNTDIHVGDYSQVLIPSDSICFCDPPYLDAKADYDGEFGIEEQKELFNWCEEMARDQSVSIIQTNRADGKFFEGMFAPAQNRKLITYDMTYTPGPKKPKFREVAMIWNPLFNDPERFGLFLS